MAGEELLERGVQHEGEARVGKRLAEGVDRRQREQRLTQAIRTNEDDLWSPTGRARGTSRDARGAES
ncbi:MAG TPA: hypothetical protein DCP69_01820 [Candidatus Omnitrophica bacterium]|nr:hypothetical protein [Candidatus Omnitrophota bacterium]